VETAAGIVEEAANRDANIIFGATVDDSFQDELRVTVIATGFDQTLGGSIKKAEEAEAPAAEENEEAPKKTVKKTTVQDIDDVLTIFRR
jgi:cell division protein FtsZ